MKARHCLILTAVCSALCSVNVYAASVYTGSAIGKNGPVEVEVTVNNGKVELVKVLKHKETNGISDPAIEKIPAEIVRNQALNVDTVAGATVTSNAIISAVGKALEKSGITLKSEQKKKVKNQVAGPDETMKVRLVILGSGAAGMSTAAEAARLGVKDILVLEKMPVRGGSTGRSSGCVLRATNDKDADNNFTPDDMYRYLMGRSNGKADPAFIRRVADMSNSTYQWLKDLGVNFTSFKPIYEGYPALRLENPNPKGTFARGSGMLIVNALYDNALKSKNVKVLMSTPAEDLIFENGRVAGVIAKKADGGKLKVLSDATVIATGGFNRDLSYQRQFARPTVGLPDETGLGNTGDGHRMAQKVGADTVFRGGKGTMLSVRADATANVPQSFMYVDGSGKRFVNENGFYDDIGNAMVNNDSQRFYRVYDSQENTEGLEKAASEGKALKADTLEELAVKMRVDPKTFENTVFRYNNLTTDVDFGKLLKFLKGIKKAPFYAINAQPEIVASFGGIKLNDKAQVVDRKGKPISGLYAAGEAANGQNYDKGYSYTGTSIQFALSAGRIAAQEIAKKAK